MFILFSTYCEPSMSQQLLFSCASIISARGAVLWPKCRTTVASPLCNRHTQTCHDDVTIYFACVFCRNEKKNMLLHKVILLATVAATLYFCLDWLNCTCNDCLCKKEYM